MWVIDKNGQKQFRANKVLADGDHMQVLNLRDSATPPHPELQKAMDAARRAKPISRTHTVNIKGALSDAEKLAFEVSAQFEVGPLRDAVRERVLDDFNRPKQHGQGPRVIDGARINYIVQQEKDRLGMTTSLHRPGFNGGMTDVDKKSQAITDRNARLSQAWKSPPNDLAHTSNGAVQFAPGVLDQPAPILNDKGKPDYAAMKDQRIENAWRR